MPIKNEKSEVVLFLVSHKDITENKDLDHGNESDTGERMKVEAGVQFHNNSHEMIQEWFCSCGPAEQTSQSVHLHVFIVVCSCIVASCLCDSVSMLSDEETGLEIRQISRPPGFNMERRRSRAVLYQLSGHLQKQDKSKSKLKINNVRDVTCVITRWYLLL